MYTASTQQHSPVKNEGTDGSLRTPVKNGGTDGSLRIPVKNGGTDSSFRTVKNGRLMVLLKMEGLKLLKKPVKKGEYQNKKQTKIESVIRLMLPR